MLIPGKYLTPLKTFCHADIAAAQIAVDPFGSKIFEISSEQRCYFRLHVLTFCLKKISVETVDGVFDCDIHSEIPHHPVNARTNIIVSEYTVEDRMEKITGNQILFLSVGHDESPRAVYHIAASSGESIVHIRDTAKITHSSVHET